MSPMGVDFPRERFLKTPVKQLKWVLSRIEEHEKTEANTLSITTARLTHLILQIAESFGGKSSPGSTVQPLDFLPFPDVLKEMRRVAGPSPETKITLSKLVSARGIPMHVFTALITEAGSSVG